MRVNTIRSMQLARQVKRRFGTWREVLEAAHVENGVHILDARAEPQHNPAA